jgi:magnesium-transporting ATPase (P-type)
VKACLLEGKKMDTENNNPYQTSVSTNPPALPREGHSKLGIASFVTAIVGGLSFFILCVSLGYMEMNTPRGVDQTSKAFILMRNGAFLALFILLLSLSLGIAGFFQKERKRIFSILGFNFSFLILFGVFLFSLSLF